MVKNSTRNLFISIIVSGAIYKWIWDTYVAIQGSVYGPLIYFMLVFAVYVIINKGKLEL